jgi:transposase
MASSSIARLDPLGIISAVMKDLGLMDLLNARLVPAAQEGRTPGEAMAGRIVNGLGFAHRPLSLPPQFFANNPLARLFREGLRPEMFTRLKLGRTRDEAYTYGCDLLLPGLALAVCAQDGIALRFKQLDTPSFALHGASVPDSEEPAMTITSGDSKDHRPDLKPAVLELLVAQAGGVPVGRKSWEGNTSEIKVFQERAQALLAAFQNAPRPRYLLADSQLSQENTTPNLQPLGFITRLPHTRSSVSQGIAHALGWDPWPRLADETRDQCLEFCHYGLAQRWLIVQSDAALERAEATLTKARQREEAVLTKPLLHLQAPRFQTPEMAPEALAAVAQRWTYHQVDSSPLIAHKRYVGKGRPTPPTPLKAIAWQLQARVRPDQEAMRHHQQVKACCVLGPKIGATALSEAEVIAAYKGQSSVDGGFRLLKDPLVFVSSLFVKKPSRIDGLLMGMTLALLVYSGAQRRMRQQRAHHHETVPNQINPPPMAPT